MVRRDLNPGKEKKSQPKRAFLFFIFILPLGNFKKRNLISNRLEKKEGKENPPKKEEKKYLMSRSNRFQVVCLMLKGKCNSLSVKIHPGSKKKEGLRKRKRKKGKKIEGKVFSEKN